MIDHGRLQASYGSAATATCSAKGGEGRKAEKTDLNNDEVTRPTVVEVDKVYTVVVLGKVLLLTNELESLRFEAARSMPLHSTELLSQERCDGAARICDGFTECLEDALRCRLPMECSRMWVETS
jgi:hypothetical protein